MSLVYEEDDNNLFICSIIFLGKFFRCVDCCLLDRYYKLPFIVKHTVVVCVYLPSYMFTKTGYYYYFSSLSIPEVKFTLLF